MKHDYDFSQLEKIKYAGQHSHAVKCKNCGIVIFTKDLKSLKQMAQDDEEECIPTKEE